MSCGRTDLPPLAEGIGQIIFDLDGCLAEQKWPVRRIVGEPIAEGVALLKHYAELNYSICIYTSRPHVDEPIIWEWVLRHKLPVDKVKCEKPMGAIIFDDRACRFPIPNINLPWAAGFYDGEGCTSQLRKGKNTAARMAVGQKDREVLDKFREIVGAGTVYRQKDKNGAPFYSWQTNSHSQVLRILDLLWPYLGTLKREQAERVLAASTWHGGNAGQFKCQDPAHEWGVRSDTGGRICRTCQRTYMKNHKARSKEQRTRSKN